MDRKSHWEHLYETNAADAVGWFQPDPSASLRLLDAAGMTTTSAVIDVGGGDSRLVDRLIDRGLRRIFVLDISRAALVRAQARLGALRDRVVWIEANVTDDWNVPAVDIWHDRAVFHFLTDAADRRRYVERLRRAVKPGGSVVMATFALDGPENCSGLPVVRYSAATLSAELGAEFVCEESFGDLHRTPSGVIQPFCYARFSRKRAGA